jgi:TRAP-type C4-dicarboxylate transport system substrate-binding protein
MKNFTVIALAIVLVVGIVLAGCAAPAPATTPAPKPTTAPEPVKPIELKFTHHDPPDGPGGKACADWASQLEKASNGKVKVTMYPAQALAKGPATVDAVLSGMADIGWSLTGFYAGRFPLYDLLTMPCIGVTSSAAGSTVAWNAFKTFPEVQKEFADFKVLILHTHQGAPIGTVKKQVKTLEDLQGMKIRATAGGALDWLKAAGASPVMMGPGDIYISTQKGVIDGWTIDMIGAEGFKLHEVTDFYTRPYYYANAFFVIMNKSKYESLPADVKALIDKLSGDQASKAIYSKQWDEDDAAAYQRMKIKPEQLYTLTDAEWARWVKVGEKVWADEIAKQEANKAPAQKVFDANKKALDDYNKANPKK